MLLLCTRSTGKATAMRAALGMLAWVVREFGPLLMFYTVNHFAGFVPALLASMAWAVGEVTLLKVQRQPISAFLKFSITVTLFFGAVDLWFQGPFLYRYESVISNVVTAVFFGLTLRGKPIIQEFAQRRSSNVPINADTLRYFRLCTMTWTGYFILKAAFYAWVSTQYELEAALAIRVLVGNATFYPLLLGSIFLARPMIKALRRWAPVAAVQTH